MSYIGNEPIVSATRTVTEVTATAGQTTFTANGGYTVGYIDVFVNGAQLQTSDFTATNGSTIVLTEAAQSGDVIRLVAWGTFQTSGAVQKTGDTMSGDLSFSGAGRRITGNFSGTLSDRLAFQDSTTNASTQANVVSNGTGVESAFVSYAGSNISNASRIRVGANSAAGVAFIESSKTGSGADLPLIFSTSSSERMRIDSSGNVGIGTSSPNTKLHVYGDGSVYGQVQSSGAGNVGVLLKNTQRSWYMLTGTTGLLQFYDDTAAATRMTIDSSGNLLVGTTSASGGITSNAGTWRFAGVAPDVNPGFLRHVANGVTQFQTFGNGNTFNTNGTYGSLSDVKLKENIEDATPKLEKLNQVRVVNYNLKTDPEQKLLGVIAQELEQIFPSMVHESPDKDEEGNDLGTTTKMVKYSVFVPILIKAVQEQQAIINDLTNRLTALENK